MLGSPLCRRCSLGSPDTFLVTVPLGFQLPQPFSERLVRPHGIPHVNASENSTLKTYSNFDLWDLSFSSPEFEMITATLGSHVPKMTSFPVAVDHVV